MGIARTRSPGETVALPVWARIAIRQPGVRWKDRRFTWMWRSRAARLSFSLTA